MKKEFWKVKTDDIDTIKSMANDGKLYGLRLTFSLRFWRWLYVATYKP